MTAAAATVLVHGLFSSSRTWDPLVSLLESDSDISNPLRILLFDYSSPKWNWRVTRRIPDLSTVADSLSTFIEVECAAYDRLILVGHSQGGLIIQTYLAKMLADGRGLDLGKIRRVVLLACPNNGSELLLLFRKSAKFWSHPQERELRPLAASIVDVQRRVRAMWSSLIQFRATTALFRLPSTLVSLTMW